MSTVKERIANPDCHRAVNYNEKAIQKLLDKYGYIMAGIKVDGLRCHVFWRDGRIAFTTREGIEFLALANCRSYFEQHWENTWRLDKRLVLDTEVWLPGVPFEETSGLLRRAEALDLNGDKRPQFVVLDLLPFSVLEGTAPTDFVTPAFELRHTAIVSRFPRPFGTGLAGGAPIVCESVARVESIDKLIETYKVARSLGYEGLIVKDPKLSVRNGKVSGMWKLKPGCGADFAPGWEGDGKIVGYVWGEHGKANAGKIVGFRVALEDGTEVNATGLTQAQITEYTTSYHAQLEGGGYAPEDGFARGRYAEVHAMEKTSKGSLRHPRFVRFRDMDYAPGVKA